MAKKKKRLDKRAENWQREKERRISLSIRSGGKKKNSRLFFYYNKTDLKGDANMEEGEKGNSSLQGGKAI